MPFGIPNEDFHSGFGLPHDYDYIEECIHTPEKTGAAMKHISELMDKYRAEYPEFYIVNAETGENRGSVVIDPYDAECEAVAEEAHDNLVRSLVEAGGEIREAKELLVRALDQLYLLGYDSGFTNPAIEQLVTDIKFYLNGGRM